jgi:hypothetical protein
MATASLIVAQKDRIRKCSEERSSDFATTEADRTMGECLLGTPSSDSREEIPEPGLQETNTSLSYGYSDTRGLLIKPENRIMLSRDSTHMALEDPSWPIVSGHFRYHGQQTSKGDPQQEEAMKLRIEYCAK